MARLGFIRFAVCLGTLLLVARAEADTVLIGYSDGQDNLNNISIFSGNTNYFTIASGSAKQSGTVSGQSIITKIGGGALTLAGIADNLNVSASVDEGTLVLGKTSSSTVHAIGAAVTIKNGATLQLAGTGDDQLFDWVAMTLNSGGTFDMNGHNEAFDGLSGGGTITNNGATPSLLTLGANNSSTFFDGVMQNGAGTLALQKNGGGTLTLTGNNTYTGATTIASGGLALLNSGRLSDSTALFLANGTTFYVNGITDTIGSLADTAADAGTGARTVQLGSGTLTVGASNTTTTYSGTVNSGTLAKTGSGAFTLAGNADNFNLTASVSAGTLVLGKFSNANVHAVGLGLTINSGGTAQLGGTGEDQIFTWTSVALNSGGTFDMNGHNEGFDNLTGSGTVTTTAATTSTLTLGENNGTATFGGVILNGSGTLAIVKTGTGTLTLTGNNTYSGGTTISGGGNLVIGHNNALGSGSVTIASGSTLDIGSQSFDLTRFAGAGSLTASSSGVFSYASGSNRTLGNLIGGSASLDKSGASTLTLTGNNTFTGTTTISAGTLALSGIGKLGSGTVFLKNGATLDLGGTTQTVAALGQLDNPVVGTITAGTINTTGYIVLQSGTSNASYTGSGANARLWIGGDAFATVTLNGTNDRVYT
ncbi:MAG: beta strand repeat-containing protein, partial [Chthoniobacterales bacterium]